MIVIKIDKGIERQMEVLNEVKESNPDLSKDTYCFICPII
jgi:hypothetical protein